MNQNISLGTFFRTKEYCPFCKAYLVPQITRYGYRKEIPLIVEDGYVKFKLVNSYVSINMDTSYYCVVGAKQMSPEDEAGFSTYYRLIKKCGRCPHNFRKHMTGLNFDNGKIKEFDTNNIRFDIHTDNEETVSVIQDYYSNKTSVKFIKLVDYCGALLPEEKHMDFPFIEFNFESPEKILNRIKTLTLFS